MKTLDPGLAAHVAQGLTTLSNCWKVERKDGVVLGFTDHDLDLVFGGVTYGASSGFTATAIEDQLGLAVSNLDAAGALSADAITEADLAAGRYDDAAVTVYRVNWADVSQRTILRRGWLGQVTRGKVAFSAELRGLATRLDQSAGRVLQRTCGWTLGDARCGIDLTAAGRHGSGVVASLTNSFEFTATGLAALAGGKLSRGKLTWTSGEDAGLSVELNSHSLSGSIATLTLMLPMGRPILVGHTFDVMEGCDNSFATCCDRFANGPNFGGFPDIAGNDYAVAYAGAGEVNDGGSRR